MEGKKVIMKQTNRHRHVVTLRINLFRKLKTFQMVQWHSDQQNHTNVSDWCRQEWFEKTKHSYLLRKVDKWKVWNPPLDLTWLQPTLLAGCQQPLWLDSNQLIGEAQDWKKRGLETKKWKKTDEKKEKNNFGGYFCLMFHPFLLPYKDWKKMHGKTFLMLSFGLFYPLYTP